MLVFWSKLWEKSPFEINWPLAACRMWQRKRISFLRIFMNFYCCLFFIQAIRLVEKFVNKIRFSLSCLTTEIFKLQSHAWPNSKAQIREQILFFAHKKLKNRPQKLLIISPNLFFHSAAQPTAHIPKLIFHIINMSQDSSVSLSVHWVFLVCGPDR